MEINVTPGLPVSNHSLQMRHPLFMRYLLIGLVSFVPVLAALLLVRFTVQGDLADFVPTGFDEVSNWHQVLTFKEVGFQGGYYTLYERPAPAAFTHFYTYGPPYPMLYGLLGKIIGWEHDTALVVNSLLMAGALFFFGAVVLTETRQILVTGLLMLVFWPGLWFLFSNMQESMHQAIGIVAAGIFYVVITRRGHLPSRMNLAFTAFLAAAAVTRLSWGVLLLPYFWLTARPRHRKLALLRCMLVGGVVMIITLYIGAPGDNSVMSVLGTFSLGLQRGVLTPVLVAIWDYFYANLLKYLNPEKSPLDVLQTIEVIMLVLGAGAAGILFNRRARTGQSTDQTARAEATFHVLNLGAIVFASLLLYIVGTGGDYRVISAHLLLSLLLLIAFRRYVPIAVIIAAYLLFAPQFLAQYPVYVEKHLFTNPVELAEFEQMAHDYIHYDPNATSAWCNTLLFHKDEYDQRLTAIPAGIGLSLLYNYAEPDVPFRSRYLLMSETVYNLFMERDDATALERLAQMPFGSNLYLNKDADCGEYSKPLSP